MLQNRPGGQGRSSSPCRLLDVRPDPGRLKLQVEATFLVPRQDAIQVERAFGTRGRIGMTAATADGRDAVEGVEP